MASKPDELPESIVLGTFQGIRNTVSRERLGPTDLESAVNVDIDDAGQVRRRRGFSQLDNTEHHSLCSIGGRVLGVRGGELGVIDAAGAFVGLGVIAGPHRVVYTQVDQTVYFTSATISGKLDGLTVSLWGMSDSAGEWVSPVLTPTDTLGEVFGQQITAPPFATEIEAYSGRIYLAAGKYVWATELWMHDYVDATRNFLQFEDEVTLLGAVDDGLYVGTTAGLYFLKGVLSGDGFQQRLVVASPVLVGSGVRAPATDVHPAARQQALPESEALIVMTGAGVCACMNGGQVYNLTSGRVEFPAAQSAAALYREDRGVSSYLAVANTGGGMSANARIGDYVDAEIIRAADRQGG